MPSANVMNCGPSSCAIAGALVASPTKPANAAAALMVMTVLPWRLAFGDACRKLSRDCRRSPIVRGSRSRDRQAFALSRALAGDLLRNQPHAIERALRTGGAGLVIFGVLVDVPHVVAPLAGDDVARGEHRRHHRVVLVIVFVHAVAADQVQGRVAAFEVEPDGGDVVAIVFVVDRI